MSRFSFLEESEYFYKKSKHGKSEVYSFIDSNEESYFIFIPDQIGKPKFIEGETENGEIPEWFEELFRRTEYELEERDKIRRVLMGSQNGKGGR